MTNQSSWFPLHRLADRITIRDRTGTTSRMGLGVQEQMSEQRPITDHRSPITDYSPFSVPQWGWEYKNIALSRSGMVKSPPFPQGIGRKAAGCRRQEAAITRNHRAAARYVREFRRGRVRRRDGEPMPHHCQPSDQRVKFGAWQQPQKAWHLIAA